MAKQVKTKTIKKSPSKSKGIGGGGFNPKRKTKK